MGRGGWWHHSPSRTGAVSKLQTHWAFIAHAHAQTPTAHRKHTNTGLSLFSAVRESRDALHTPLSLLLWPCFDPVLNSFGRALCTHVWCCMCPVYGEYICSTLLRRHRCQRRITKRFLWFRVDRRGDSVVRGERNVWQTSRVSASLSEEANALLFKIQYLCSFSLHQQSPILSKYSCVQI